MKPITTTIISFLLYLRACTPDFIYKSLWLLVCRMRNSKYQYIHNSWRRFVFYEPPSLDERSKLDHNALWSATRSGNHWVRFIVEYLTAQPTHGDIRNRKDVPIFMNVFPSPFHPLAHVRMNSDFTLYKSHFAYSLTEKSTLLLLVRDFHEYVAHTKLPTNNAKVVRSAIMRYIRLIRAYHNFLGTKMLIYYEDLVLEPEKEIRRIKDFFNVSEVCYRTFMKQYDFYGELSRKGTNRFWYGNNSQLDTQFHQKNNSKKVIDERIGLLHEFLAKPEYQQVKPYIARYMH